MPPFIQHALAAVLAPGFFASGQIRTALLAGAVVALVSGASGVFTVLRGQSFAGHALSDLGTLGGSGAYLLGIAPLWGFIGTGVAVAGAMDALDATDAAGTEHRRSRDVSTGIVLGAVLGLSALLIYLDTTNSTTTGETVSILFGSLFDTSSGTLPAMLAFAGLGLAVIAVLYRPLLLGSVHPDLAAARGVPVRLLGLLFLVVTGVAVSLSSLVVGTILSPALLIGPAAAALRLTRRPARAMAVAAALGLTATWAGIVLSYDSYAWPPAGGTWPVSSFVVAIVFAFYLLSGPAGRRLARRAGERPDEAPGSVPGERVEVA